MPIEVGRERVERGIRRLPPLREDDPAGGLDWISDLAFFFSSRRRHTRWTGDWSSDVCSSDLRHQPVMQRFVRSRGRWLVPTDWEGDARASADAALQQYIAEHGMRAFQQALKIGKRRVGKECRSRWSR